MMRLKIKLYQNDAQKWTAMERLLCPTSAIIWYIIKAAAAALKMGPALPILKQY